MLKEEVFSPVAYRATRDKMSGTFIVSVGFVHGVRFRNTVQNSLNYMICVEESHLNKVQ